MYKVALHMLIVLSRLTKTFINFLFAVTLTHTLSSSIIFHTHKHSFSYPSFVCLVDKKKSDDWSLSKWISRPSSRAICLSEHCRFTWTLMPLAFLVALSWPQVASLYISNSCTGRLDLPEYLTKRFSLLAVRVDSTSK